MDGPEPLIRLAIDDRIARITFCRPDRLNAFNVGMHKELARAIEAVAACEARALLITGEGRAFSVGQDLNDEAIAPHSGRDVAELLDLYYNPLIEKLMALPLPVVCAVNGAAAGAAVAMALACDVVVAARSASFRIPFAALGLAPDAGCGWLLPKALGLPRALGLAFTGDAFTADQALQWGVIWSVVDDADLKVAAVRLAEGIGAQSLPALMAARRLLRESGTRTLSAQLAEERRVQGALCASPDYEEGIGAFRERRAPSFGSRSKPL